MAKNKFKKIIDEYENIENEFFDIDHEKKIARVKLIYDTPRDLFDNNFATARPVLTDDFFDWINYVVDAVPKKYRIDLEVCFKDLEGYSVEQLTDNFKKNVILQYKTGETAKKRKNRIAFILIGTGVTFFVANILAGHLWTDGGLVKDIAAYVADIAATVTIWEALTILLVDRTEDTGRKRDYLTRFEKIEFKLTK